MSRPSNLHPGRGTGVVTDWAAAGLAVVLGDLLAPARRCRSAWRGWRTRGQLTTAGRVKVTLTTLILAIGGGATSAAAAGGGAGVLNTFDAAGSSGIKISQFTLDVDHGGFTDPVKAVTALILSMLWDTYREAVGVAIWLYNQATSYGWVDAALGPARSFAAGLENVIIQVGVIPLALTIAAFIGGGWMLRGRWAGGLAELAVSCVLAVLATGALSHPVDLVAGSDGLLGRAEQFGTELSAVIVSGGTASSSDPAALKQQTTAALVDAFLRGPHELVNYGAVIDDDPKCKAVYDKVMAAGPYTDSTARDALGACRSSYGDYAANPSTEQMSGMLVLLPGGTLLLLLVIALAVVMFAASAVVIWEAAKLAWSMVKGIIPGAGRDGLYQGLAAVAVSLAINVGALAFLSIYVLILRGALEQKPGQARNPAATFMMVDLLLIVAIVVLFRWRSQARQAARRMAERASRMGPGSATRLPSGGHRFPIGSLIGGLVGQRLTTAALASKMGRDTRGLVTGSGSAGGGHAAGRLQARLSRSRQAGGAMRAGRALWTVGKYAAMSTVGAPVYAPRAAKAVKAAAAARSTAMRAKLATASAGARAFGQEYAHNVAVAARFAGKVSGATHVAGALVTAGAPSAAAAVLAATVASASPTSAPRPRTVQVGTGGAAQPAGASAAPARPAPGPTQVPTPPPGTAPASTADLAQVRKRVREARAGQRPSPANMAQLAAQVRRAGRGGR